MTFHLPAQFAAESFSLDLITAVVLLIAVMKQYCIVEPMAFLFTGAMLCEAMHVGSWGRNVLSNLLPESWKPGNPIA